MDIANLPVGETKLALEFPHFPTRLQAVVWRNWGLVSVERLARVLHATPSQIEALAADMLLVKDESLTGIWHDRGYLTIIRRNWHLLPYEQLLKLLGWSAQELEFVLKEDDFLWIKLGCLKPTTEPIYYKPLTAEEKIATEELRNTLANYFPDENASERTEQPFDFLKKYGQKKRQNDVNPTASTFGMKLAYSYSAVYGDPLLEDKCDPYPDALLSDYQAAGINAVWLQGVLYNLVPWLGDLKISEGWKTRLLNLQKLCQRAEKYGIKVYLYLNEPRSMPMDFFDDHPDWKGVLDRNSPYCTLCTSKKPVLDAMQHGVAELVSAIPNLGGIFTITMSENLTNCCSRPDIEKSCPICSERGPAQIVAEVNATIAKGAHSVNPDVDVIAWTWAWKPEWDEKAIELLPTDVKLMCVSETDVVTDASGVKGVVLDYSISKVGPGPTAKRLWKKARERGLKIVAKVQLNNTWECSAVPYIPTPSLVETHLKNLEQQGVSDLMLSWTLGGYPGGNIELLQYPMDELAVEKFGEEAAPQIIDAWKLFGDAFEKFPLHLVDQLYNAPQNFGPMSLLFEKPTGYNATMIGFPYDDLKTWCGGHYSEEILEKQFKMLSEGLSQGLDVLKSAQNKIPADKADNFTDLMNVAEAFYCHFRSTYLQIRFVRQRNANNAAEISAILDEEISLAFRLYEVVIRDSRIGFEASNHYYYTVNDLKEKILNCSQLKKRWA